jgi:hypothetical protein
MALNILVYTRQKLLCYFFFAEYPRNLKEEYTDSNHGHVNPSTRMAICRIIYTDLSSVHLSYPAGLRLGLSI